MRFKTILLTIAGIFSAVANLHAESEMLFSYANTSLKSTTAGFRVAEKYDVAVIVPKDYAGCKIKGLRVPVVDSADVTDYSAWLTTKLNTEYQNGVSVNAPNICSKEGTPSGGYLDINFDEPYTIPESGDVFIGYSFTVKKLSEQACYYPVCVTNEVVEGSCYMRTNESYKTWTDYSKDAKFCTMIAMRLLGDFQENMVAISDFPAVYASRGLDGIGKVTIVNHGGNQINDIDYTYTMNGKTVSDKLVFNKPVDAMAGALGNFEITFPAMTSRATYDLTLEITKVNGVDNDDPDKTFTTTYNVVNRIPKKNPVMEEYTGTWCGWCPRGLVGLQKLAEKVPESICISYHGGDPMYMKGGYPGLVQGFPYATLDRLNTIDAYYGYGNTPLGIIDDYKSRAKLFTEGEVKVKAEWADAEKSAINVTSTTTFIADSKNTEYRVGYVVLADGLSSPDWEQANYYAQTGTYVGQEGIEDWVYKPTKVNDVVFDDVAVYIAGKNGIEESLPMYIEAEKGIKHDITFNVKDMVNDKDNVIVQDKDKLRVVAIIYKKLADGKWEIINAAKCDVPGESKTQGTSALRNVLIEEFTGTWCGNCVRGTAALEWLKENYPDVIRVAYHGGTNRNEVMNMKNGYPNYVSNYPAAVVDRTLLCDPYFGTNISFDNPLGIKDVIEERFGEPNVATAEVSAWWSDDKSKINVYSAVNFNASLKEDMRIGYILVADGLTGDGVEWSQVNGCSGIPSYNIEALEKFYEAPQLIEDMVYNDVAIFSSGTDGITNVIPSSVKGGQTINHSYEINVADCVNLNGMSLIQNRDNLRVIAFVVKKGGTFGTQTLTAARSNGIADLSGMEETLTEKVLVGTEYYDLAGRKTLRPADGIFVKVDRYSDGTAKTSKVMIRQ